MEKNNQESKGSYVCRCYLYSKDFRNYTIRNVIKNSEHSAMSFFYTNDKHHKWNVFEVYRDNGDGTKHYFVERGQKCW